MLRNSIKHGLELIPLVVLVDFPTVQIEVRNSALPRHLIERAQKLLRPAGSRSELGEIVVRALNIEFQQTMPKLNMRRVRVGICAHPPAKRVIREVIQKEHAGTRREKTCFRYLSCDAAVKLSAWVAERNNFMAQRVLQGPFAVVYFSPRAVRRKPG